MLKINFHSAASQHRVVIDKCRDRPGQSNHHSISKIISYHQGCTVYGEILLPGNKSVSILNFCFWLINDPGAN